MIPRKSELRKRERIAADPERSPKHLSWLRRSFVCAAWKSGECEGPNHAHHIRSAATAGTGMKPSDFDAVPLCAAHHDELHRAGQNAFEEKYGVNLLAEARKLAKASPHKPREVA
jgi:hypothetical protein